MVDATKLYSVYAAVPSNLLNGMSVASILVGVTLCVIGLVQFLGGVTKTENRVFKILCLARARMCGESNAYKFLIGSGCLMMIFGGLILGGIIPVGHGN